MVQRATSGATTQSKTAAAPASTMSGTVSPFSLTGVQRQVKVGASGDAAEHEANRVADHVTGGSPSSKPAISRMETLQRQTTGTADKEAPVQRAASEAKKEDAPATPAVQRAEAEVQKDAQKEAKKEETPSAAVQRATAESKTEDAHVQKAAAEEKKDTSPVQRAPAEETKPTVQRAGAEEKKEATVQRSCCCTESQADRRPSGTATVFCKFHNETESDDSVRRKEAGDLDRAAAHAISTKDTGMPLRPAIRQQLEARMGADLSPVRVHEGPAAQESAAALNARAFTHQGDIWLGRGESQDNLNLMAHEATHVVQQGAAVRRSPEAVKHRDEEQPVVRRSVWDSISGVAGAFYDKTKGLVDAAGNAIAMGADFFWKAVQQFAPAWIINIIDGIRSKGIVGYLRDKLSGAFNSIFGGLSSGGGGVIAGVMATFGKLAGTASDIISALGRGDCKPLFDAVTRLGDAIKEMAGEAWEKIKDFFAPIGDFFAGLWKKFGAPIVDFLGEFAADIWNDIKALGQKIWDGTQPVRDAVAAAWKWVKDQLGIGDEPEGQNGLLQWVEKKLGEAWDWFKEKLQPIIGPMQAMVEKIKAIIPLDKILHLRETVHEWLQHATQMVTNMRQPKGVTQNQDALRAQILPAVKAAIVGLKGKIAGAGSWVAEQIGGIAQTVTGLFASLRSNPILGKLSGAIQWVEDKISGLATWVQGGVVSLFNTIGNGVAKLADFIEPVLNVLKKIVSVIVNIVKELPGLVLGPVWKAIPACIRDPIKDFIIENILSQIPIISTFVKIPEIWGKIQKLVMDFLTQVFVNGDLGGAVMTVIRFVLEAAGVDVDLMLSVLAKAASSLDEIIMHPVKFLSNLAGAVGQGLHRFVSNIGTHLVTGLVNWLTGPLKDLGVEPIKDLSLNSIFGLVLGILGVTEAKIRAKVEKAVGAKAMKVLEAAWKWIKALITGGIGGLWNEIKSQLSDLGSMILGGITQWITVEIVEVAVAKLIKMCNPVGAIIEAIQTIYKAVSFFVNKINEILALVDSVLNSIQKIVAGDIGSAAAWIESALARTIPAVLAFFAKWLGISDPGPKVKEIVVKIQGKVEKAMDWLVDKAIAIGKKIMGALGLGGKEDERTDEQKKADLHKGVTEGQAVLKEKGATPAGVSAKLPAIRTRYKLTALSLVKLDGNKYEIKGSVNPDEEGDPVELAADEWPVAVDDHIVGVPGSTFIEKVVSLNPDNTITYTVTARGQAAKSTRSKESFMQLWNAKTIQKSGEMSADEERAELTRLYGAQVADAIMNRADLAANLKPVNDEQAHHVIPIEILKKEEMFRSLVRTGWDFNQKMNGVALAEGFHGNHPSYTKYISVKIRDWVDQNSKSNTAAFQAYVENNLIPHLKGEISIAKSKFGTTDENLNDYFAKL